MKLNPAPVERAALMTDPLAKLAWFVSHPLANVSTLALLPPVPAVSAMVATVVVLGLLALLQQGRFRQAAALGMLILLLPATYTPTLAVAENWPSFRSLFCVYALAIFTLAAALRGVVGTQRGVLSAVLVLGALVSLPAFAYQARVRLAQPAALETRLLTEALRRIDTAHTTRIHIIGPQWTQSASDRVWYDEFGFPTSAHFWCGEHLVYTLTREMPAARRDALTALPCTWGEPLPDAPATTAQIDMRDLLYWRAANQ